MHRAWIVLLFLPLAGCLGSDPAAIPIEVGSRILGFDTEGRGNATPVPVGDCGALLDTLNARVADEASARLEYARDRGWVSYGPGYWDARYAMGGPEVAAEPSADAATGGAGGTAAQAEVTGTNNQEVGADEADLVKTDGEWTYVLLDGTLRILHSQDVGDIELRKSIEMGGWGGQLLFDEDRDRLVVITPAEFPGEDPKEPELYADYMIWPGYRSSTRIATYDVSDRGSPVLVDERHVDGSNSGARLIDGVAHVVVTHNPDWLRLQWRPTVDDDLLEELNVTWDAYFRLDAHNQTIVREAAYNATVQRNAAVLANLTLDDHLPRVHHEGLEDHTPFTCGRVLSPEDGTGRSVNTIVSFDVRDTDARMVQILGSHPIVYAAPGALVLAERSQDSWWYWDRPQVDEATNLHWFDIDGMVVQHRATGRIAGTVQDSFSIDVEGDALRVITTTGQWGRWWMDDPEPMANHLAVFRDAGDELIEVGAVSGFAKEERVWSARFTQDRAYVVTFRQIDPLWIIDLSVPHEPKILGELEIPGVSTYLHPINDDRLLSIGIAPRGDQGLDWSKQEVSLFDTSDPTDPKRLDVVSLSPGEGWSWSTATNEHKAFTYWDKIDMLAVPVSSYTNYRTEAGYYYDHLVGLRLIEVEDDGLNVYGDVRQDHLIDERRWWSGQVERSYFLGFPDAWPLQPVSVYSVSRLGVTAHDLASLDLQGSAPFPDPYDQVYY